ncbi:Hypothetical predicted protein [Marmota monax]|uniref:Uncharacterized protein n=1 Tax=Marmota monax TaxID=9995 RepID=A0A5E4C5R0_MARMO|nr:hypothetical protein GHT09_009550 [Marmota monax]VTJ76232.1 Hypothetical predicted protein [Marmota monax]
MGVASQAWPHPIGKKENEVDSSEEWLSKTLKKERFIETKQSKQNGIGPPEPQTELSLLDWVVWDVYDLLKGQGQKLDGEVEQSPWTVRREREEVRWSQSKGKA